LHTVNGTPLRSVSGTGARWARRRTRAEAAGALRISQDPKITKSSFEAQRNRKHVYSFLVKPCFIHRRRGSTHTGRGVRVRRALHWVHWHLTRSCLGVLPSSQAPTEYAARLSEPGSDSDDKGAQQQWRRSHGRPSFEPLGEGSKGSRRPRRRRRPHGPRHGVTARP
jgi:hypothetical protein